MLCKQFVATEFDQLDKIMLYKIAAKFEMKRLGEKCLSIIKKNVESLNFIELLKFAFDYDFEGVKKSLRCFIYTSEREIKWYCCSECKYRIERKDCTHTKESTELTRNSLVAEHIDEILKMAPEIQSFVLKSSVDFE